MNGLQMYVNGLQMHMNDMQMHMNGLEMHQRASWEEDGEGHEKDINEKENAKFDEERERAV
eukprot:14002408-Alexandrium_andersonii.AAC.1